MEPLLIDALAAHRIARLIVTDRIFRAPRSRLMAALARYPAAQELLECEWCAGVWVAGAVTVARLTVPRVWAPVARALAVADAVGIVSTFTSPAL